MTKAGSVQQAGTKPLRKGRSVKSSVAQPIDVCELFLAELRARRERLQQLLSMIHVEANRTAKVQSHLHPRHKCTGLHHRPDA